ncbi:MAG: WG repeat-containing protein [Planctomycetaceae bacterium]|nr:WG repeat-containing protein [Planctomycetaceae bacterium]
MKFVSSILLGVAFAACSLSLAWAGEETATALVRFIKNDKLGFKDAAGRVVIEPVYDNAGDFAFGLAPVNVGAKWQFPGIKDGGKWGYINTQGTVVVPLTLEFAHKFSDGLARVWDGGRDRYIDLNGKTVITLLEGSGGDFREGVAPVSIDKPLGDNHWQRQTKFIDKNGKTVFVLDGYAKEFYEGFAVLCLASATVGEEKYGFIDHSGRTVISPRFVSANRFSDGLAAVATERTGGMADGWGYIDKSGRFVIKPRFNEAEPFRNGVAMVHVGGVAYQVMDGPVPYYWKGGEWQLIHKTGAVLKRSKERFAYEETSHVRAKVGDNLLAFEGTVISLEASPIQYSMKNYLVTMRVDRVVKGKFDGKTFQFRVHSPASSGLEVGKRCTVEAKRTPDGYVVEEHQWPGRLANTNKTLYAALFTEGREIVIEPDPNKMAAAGVKPEQLDFLKRRRFSSGDWTVEVNGINLNLADVAKITERDLVVRPFTVTLRDGREVVVTPDAKKVGRYLVTSEAFEEDVRARLSQPDVKDPAKIAVLSGIPVPGGRVPNFWKKDRVHISVGEPLETFGKVEVRTKTPVDKKGI